MRFTVDTKSLQEGLSIVNYATSATTATPILGNILIKVNFNNIVLVASNSEMAIEYVLSEGVTIEQEGKFSLPSKIFTSYIGLLDDDRVNLELLADDSMLIKTDTGEIKIKGCDASDFPIIPTIKETMSFDISGNILKKSIEKTLFSVAEGNIRPTLAGIFVNIQKDFVSFASTDIFRLSEYKTALDLSIDNNFEQIIPAKTMAQISRIIAGKDNIKVITGENQIAFLINNIKVYSSLLNGKFPDYKNHFPTSYSTKCVINRQDFIQALKKINLISRESNYAIHLSISIENGILLETSETQIGEGKVQLIGSVEGVDNVIGINSTYLLESLNTMESSHVGLSFETPLSPVFILPVDDNKKKGEFKHIIMPLKI